MPDQTNEWKEAMITAADRAVEIVLAQRGFHLAGATGDQGQYFGASAGETTYETFSTGYDGTSTTFVFRLDLSLLDGNDRLA